MPEKIYFNRITRTFLKSFLNFYTRTKHITACKVYRFDIICESFSWNPCTRVLCIHYISIIKSHTFLLKALKQIHGEVYHTPAKQTAHEKKVREFTSVFSISIPENGLVGMLKCALPVRKLLLLHFFLFVFSRGKM